jgi:hypothetical protein
VNLIISVRSQCVLNSEHARRGEIIALLAITFGRWIRQPLLSPKGSASVVASAAKQSRKGQGPDGWIASSLRSSQ